MTAADRAWDGVVLTAGYHWVNGRVMFWNAERGAWKYEDGVEVFYTSAADAARMNWNYGGPVRTDTAAGFATGIEADDLTEEMIDAPRWLFLGAFSPGQLKPSFTLRDLAEAGGYCTDGLTDEDLSLSSIPTKAHRASMVYRMMRAARARALPIPSSDALAAKIAEAVEREREACAKIADGSTCGCCGMDGKAGAAIRARARALGLAVRRELAAGRGDGE